MKYRLEITQLNPAGGITKRAKLVNSNYDLLKTVEQLTLTYPDTLVEIVILPQTAQILT